MNQQIKPDTWLWVIIQDPEKKEEIVGQHEETSSVTFIPAFESKEDALRCMNQLSLAPDAKHEAQAIIFEDLEAYAGDHGALIYILTAEGTLKETITPQQV